MAFVVLSLEEQQLEFKAVRALYTNHTHRWFGLVVHVKATSTFMNDTKSYLKDDVLMGFKHFGVWTISEIFRSNGYQWTISEGFFHYSQQFQLQQLKVEKVFQARGFQIKGPTLHLLYDNIWDRKFSGGAKVSRKLIYEENKKMKQSGFSKHTVWVLVNTQNTYSVADYISGQKCQNQIKSSHQPIRDIKV